MAWFSNIWEQFKGWVTGAWDALKNAFDSVIGWIKEKFDAFIGGIKKAWDTVKGIFQKIFGGGSNAKITVTDGTGGGTQKHAAGAIFTGYSKLGNHVFGEVDMKRLYL